MKVFKHELSWLRECRSHNMVIARNIANLDYIQQTIDRLSEGQPKQVKEWLNTTFKKYLINKYDNTKQIRKVPKNAPEWLITAIKNREKVFEVVIKPNFYREVREHILPFLRTLPNLRRVSFDQAVDGKNKWEKALAKQKVEENIKSGVKVVKKYPNGYYWGNITKEKTLYAVGDILQNCLREEQSGDEYWDAIENKDSVIIVLFDSQDKPHVAIEYSLYDDSIEQAVGKQNKIPKGPYLHYTQDFIINPPKHFNIDNVENVSELGLMNKDDKFITLAEYFKDYNLNDDLKLLQKMGNIKAYLVTSEKAVDYIVKKYRVPLHTKGTYIILKGIKNMIAALLLSNREELIDITVKNKKYNKQIAKIANELVKSKHITLDIEEEFGGFVTVKENGKYIVVTKREFDELLRQYTITSGKKHRWIKLTDDILEAFILTSDAHFDKKGKDYYGLVYNYEYFAFYLDRANRLRRAMVGKDWEDYATDNNFIKIMNDFVTGKVVFWKKPIKCDFEKYIGIAKGANLYETTYDDSFDYDDDEIVIPNNTKLGTLTFFTVPGINNIAYVLAKKVDLSRLKLESELNTIYESFNFQAETIIINSEVDVVLAKHIFTKQCKKLIVEVDGSFDESLLQVLGIDELDIITSYKRNKGIIVETSMALKLQQYGFIVNKLKNNYLVKAPKRKLLIEI